jgi:hypothetical protein
LDKKSIDRIDNLVDCLKLVEPNRSLYDNFLMLEGLASIIPYAYDDDHDAFMSYLGMVYPDANMYKSTHNLFIIEKNDTIYMIVFNSDSGYFDKHIVLSDILYFNGNNARRKFVLNSLNI